MDLVPSGLAPVARTDGWVGDAGAMGADGRLDGRRRSDGPYRIVGQEVDFSVSYDPSGTRPMRLRYLARIVTPGDFGWEPASIPLAAAPDVAAFTAPGRVAVADR